MQGHWKTLQASQLGRSRLHLIWKNCDQFFRVDRERPRGDWTGERQVKRDVRGCWKLTLRLRQDLQFIASRGSTVARRGVNRSMLTCGRDIAHGGHSYCERGM